MSPEHNLASAIVEAWSELDKKSEAENPDEFRQARELFEKWAGKLEALLRGK